VAPGVKAIAVPGSQGVGLLCAELGIDQVFRDAGFEWREAGCSMCLAMNPDKLVGDQLCASSSNRNFKGRQGSPTGRTDPDEPADGRRRRRHRRSRRRPRGLQRQLTPTPPTISMALEKITPSPAAASPSPATTSTPTASSRRAS
jgi:hypothetical protein